MNLGRPTEARYLASKTLAVGSFAAQTSIKSDGHPAGSHCVAPLGYRTDNSYGFFETALGNYGTVD